MPSAPRTGLLLWVLLTASLIGCGGATLGAPQVGSGRNVVVRDLDVSIDIPAGFERKKPLIWALDAGGVRHAFLWLERRAKPDQGVEAWLNKSAADLGRFGMAGIIRRQPVEIGDLQGQIVEAITLVGQQRHAVMQLVVEAEDGMYLVSILGTIDAMRRNHKAFDAALRSFRIPQR